jgi:hypothetical protein
VKDRIDREKKMLQRIGRKLRREWENQELRQRLPEQTVLLLTNPRSGGTWLFDALRCHPALVVYAQADFFAYLGLKGRRYPTDLQGDRENGVDIEVRPGEWEQMPRFVLPSALTSPARRRDPYALEKLHPHFFDFDATRFTAKLRGLAPDTQAKIIYQVRDPRESITSFLRYKERNPAWNSQLTPEEVFPFMRQTYEALNECSAAFPGFILDYDALEADLPGALKRIFAWLWPGKLPSSDPDLLADITAAIEPHKRGATLFFGGAPAIDDTEALEARFAQHAADLEACYTAYRAILARAAGDATA